MGRGGSYLEHDSRNSYCFNNCAYSVVSFEPIHNMLKLKILIRAAI